MLSTPYYVFTTLDMQCNHWYCPVRTMHVCSIVQTPFALLVQLFHKFDIASVIERAEHGHAFEYFADDQHSSLMLYRTMQLQYKPAEYLSVVKCASNRRLISNFRTGCHGLRVDTGRWADGVHLDKDRQAMSSVQVIELCGGRAALCV